MNEFLRVVAAIAIVWVAIKYPLSRGIAVLAVGVYTLISGEVFGGIFITALGLFATYYFWVNK